MFRIRKIEYRRFALGLTRGNLIHNCKLASCKVGSSACSLCPNYLFTIGKYLFCGNKKLTFVKCPRVKATAVMCFHSSKCDMCDVQRA